MLRSQFYKSVFAISAFLMGSSAFAVEGFNLGGLLGMDFLSGGGAASASNLGFGARLGYHLNPTWEVGGSFTTATNSTQAGIATASSTTALMMGDLNYHFEGDLNPFSVGLRLGLGMNSGSNTDTSASFAYGVTSGYDFRVSQNFTLGPRVSYTMISLPESNQGSFQGHAAFKYFF